MDELRGLSRSIDVYGVAPAAASPVVADGDLSPSEAAIGIVEAIDTILNDATVESSGGDSVMYRVDVEAVAAVDGAPPESAILHKLFADLETRAEVRMPAVDRAELSLLFGPQRHRAIRCNFHADGVDFDLQLDGAYGALILLGELIDRHLLPKQAKAMIDNSGLRLVNASGRLRVSMAAVGDSGFHYRLAIPERIESETEGDSGPWKFVFAATDNLWSMEADGAAGELTMASDMGPMLVRAPYVEFVDVDSAPGEVEIEIPGLSFDLHFASGQQSLVIENFGFGDGTATIRKGDDNLVELDLNADKGRRLGLSFAPSSKEGRLAITLEPRLNLTLAFSLSTIQKDLDDEFPEFLVNETYSLAIGGVGATRITTIPEGQGSSGGVLVNKGKLTLKSTSADKALVVAEGKCLVTRDPDAPRLDESHVILRTLDSVKLKAL